MVKDRYLGAILQYALMPAKKCDGLQYTKSHCASFLFEIISIYSCRSTFILFPTVQNILLLHHHYNKLHFRSALLLTINICLEKNAEFGMGFTSVLPVSYMYTCKYQSFDFESFGFLCRHVTSFENVSQVKSGTY